MPGLRAAVLKKSGFLDELGAGNLPGTLERGVGDLIIAAVSKMYF